MSGLPKVLFIAGAGRSGTTLLDLLLGQAEGVFSAGELHRYWDQIDADDATCGCGKSLRDCPVWREVEARLAEADKPLDREGLREVYHHRLRFRPGQLADATVRNDEAMRDWARSMLELYAAVAATTGSSVIVDSSKEPQFARVLSRRRELDLYVVHVVRDPRGVAYSNARTTLTAGSTNPFPRLRPLRSTTAWTARNGYVEAFLRRRLPRRLLTVRYEDVVEQPQRTLSQIADFIGATAPGSLAADGMVRLGENHTVVGNPIRHVRRDLSIRLDDEWKTQMPPTRLATATVVAAPLLRRYGYPLSRASLTRQVA